MDGIVPGFAERALATSAVASRHENGEYADRLSLVVRNMTSAVIITDVTGRAEWSNEAFTRLTGIPAAEIKGHHPGPLLQGDGTDPATRAHMRACIARGEGFETEVLNYRRDGRPYWVAISCSALRDEAGALTGFIAVQSDITARRQAEERARREAAEAEASLRHQAQHDPLTGLANRSALLVAFERALANDDGAGRPGGTLVLFDVDHFKQINDTHGHDVGDALLVELARRLRALARPEDVIARLGGDEFVLLAPGADAPEAAAARVRDIHEALSGALQLLGQRLEISLSSGVTVFPADGRDVHRLLKNADLALYEAKRSGRGAWRAFRPEQAAALCHRARMAEALRRAVAGKRIAVAWAPRRALRGGDMAFDAVPHWHYGRRLVSPGELFSVAEEGGLTGELGRTLMESALARLAVLRASGYAPGRVALRASGRAIRDPGFLGETKALLRRFGLDPSHLEITVTEDMLFGHAADAVEDALRALNDHGIAIALDTPACGFLSLARLARLPVGRIRIDASVIRDIGRERGSGAVVRAAIGLAHGLGIEAVAAGVETPAQLWFLDRAGCDEVQGPLIAPPLTTTEDAAYHLARSHAVATHFPAWPSVHGRAVNDPGRGVADRPLQNRVESGSAIGWLESEVEVASPADEIDLTRRRHDARRPAQLKAAELQLSQHDAGRGAQPAEGGRAGEQRRPMRYRQRLPQALLRNRPEIDAGEHARSGRQAQACVEAGQP
jgi:diguanylate cyclase (GGDEF)-like protein/PAS domain S-box-containing protein